MTTEPDDPPIWYTVVDFKNRKVLFHVYEGGRVFLPRLINACFVNDFQPFYPDLVEAGPPQ
jgi:hypothetical protein